MNEIYIFYAVSFFLCVICAVLLGVVLNDKKTIESLKFSKNEFENLSIEQKVRLENEALRAQESKEINANLSQKLERKSIENDALEDEILNLKTQISSLKTTLEEREKIQLAKEENFVQVKKNLSTEFENLANKIFEEKSANFNKNSQTSLELLLNPLKEQIQNFQKRTNEIHDKTQQNSLNLENELKKVLDIGLGMSREASNLTNALKGNNKIAGNWGEMQLEATLQAAGLVKNEQYRAQESFKSESGARMVPDFVVYLPDNKHIIIDSKVSLVAYEVAMSAVNENEMKAALSEHVKSVKSHIDELSKKNYSMIEGLESPDFVMMFMPIEAAYIEALKYERELFGYGYERKVVLVSHTTLMPILRTVANLWRIEKGNKEAIQIAASAGEIYNKICVVAQDLNKLGATLTTATRQYNQVVTSLAGRQGLYGKTQRFRQLSQKATQNMPEVGELEIEVESAKLENLSKKDDDGSDRL